MDVPIISQACGFFKKNSAYYVGAPAFEGIGTSSVWE